MKGGNDMALFSMRDSWNVWRRKVNLALGGVVDGIDASEVDYSNTSSGLTATDVQSAIDEVAEIGDTKLQYNNVANTVVNIFDLMDNNDEVRIYGGYSTNFNNGETDLKTLLSISQYARVELYKYNKYLAVLRITDVSGTSFVGYANANLTSLSLLKIASTGNTTVTITKAE